MPKTRSNKDSTLKAPTLEAVAEYIQKNEVKNIIVMTGAGISTAAGIPDFRSENTGLYHNLQKFKLPYAEAVFDISYFVDNPEPFYELAKELYPGKFLPTKTHYFVKLLKEKGVLLRNFTQNIDTLERMTGLDEEYIVEAHGSFASASCIGETCKRKADIGMVKRHALQGKVPKCPDCGDLIKPDITFFGEQLPEKFHTCQKKDFPKADLLIVIGTSLKVQPFASLVDYVLEDVPRLLINREEAGVHYLGKGGKYAKEEGFDFKWKYTKRDVFEERSCDEGIEKLAALLGWEKDLDRLYKEGNRKLESIWKEEVATKEQDVDELADLLDKSTIENDDDVDKLTKTLEKLTAEDNQQEENDETGATVIKEESRVVKNEGDDRMKVEETISVKEEKKIIDGKNKGEKILITTTTTTTVNTTSTVI